MRTICLCVALLCEAGSAASALEMSVDTQKTQTCSASTIDILGAFLGVNSFSQEAVGNAAPVIAAAACKRNPGNSRMLIAVVAYDNGKEDEKTMVIAFVDEAKREIAASVRSEIGEDAAMKLDSSSLRIDTAPYTLAPGVRAFGIDLTSGYIPHCGGAGTGAQRTLYVQEGRRLRPVFGLTMSSWSYVKGGEPRCTADPEAEALIENLDLSIGVDNKVTNGYRDLIVSAIIYNDGGAKPKDNSFLYRVRYDGREYRRVGPAPRE